ncbi:tetratricopeptide repeat protein [Streptomyces sp. NPDC060027]|uniref:tetratricopeptide repeat protein n=1 Tax=Streptomyces sp. NPDC060027 TaxID=3347040 RepID=UPI003681E6B7
MESRHGRSDEALTLLNPILRTSEGKLGPNHLVEMGSALHTLADIHAERGNFSAAKENYRSALHIEARRAQFRLPRTDNSLAWP